MLGKLILESPSRASPVPEQSTISPLSPVAVKEKRLKFRKFEISCPDLLTNLSGSQSAYSPKDSDFLIFCENDKYFIKESDLEVVQRDKNYTILGLSNNPSETNSVEPSPSSLNPPLSNPPTIYVNEMSLIAFNLAELYCSALNYASKQPLLLLTLKINDEFFQSLVDCGATRTFANPEILRFAQKLKLPVISKNGNVQFANGETTAVSLEITLPLELQGNQKSLSIRILDSLPFNTFLLHNLH